MDVDFLNPMLTLFIRIVGTLNFSNVFKDDQNSLVFSLGSINPNANNH